MTLESQNPESLVVECPPPTQFHVTVSPTLIVTSEGEKKKLPIETEAFVAEEIDGVSSSRKQIIPGTARGQRHRLLMTSPFFEKIQGVRTR
jgi:hypothetical protein